MKLADVIERAMLRGFQLRLPLCISACPETSTPCDSIYAEILTPHFALE